MPYPETCPECGGRFRNTGSHFTGRRNELGRHVLLELSCQSTSRRFWWDFTTGQVAPDGKTAMRNGGRELVGAAAASAAARANGSLTGHARLEAQSMGTNPSEPLPFRPDGAPVPLAAADLPEPQPAAPSAERPPPAPVGSPPPPPSSVETTSPDARPSADLASLRAAFARQLQLDRLTLRQMRTWLPGDDARRSAEVAASATEAAYERLALTLFGAPLARVLGQEESAATPPGGLSAEERLEIQREKARIRARQRRATLKAARLARD